MSHTVVVVDRTRRLRRPGFIKLVVEALLEAEDQPPSTIEVLVTDEDGIRELNREYRGVDRATDVLSFPSGDGPESGNLLGEVAVCLPIAEEQALSRGVSVESEVACLAVHGSQHLLGYDDDADDSRVEMIEKMNRVVSSLGYEIADDWGSIYAKR